MKVHRSQRKEVATWNEGLAEFLAKGKPEYKELATVPEADRFRMEAELIRTLASSYSLLNKYCNGYRHSPETRAKISAGVRRHYAMMRN